MTLSGKAATKLLAMSILLCFAASVRASTFVMPTDDEMVIRARAIVRGKVLAIESGLDQNQNSIFTYVTLKVQEVLKGQITQHKIVLKQPGGEFGARGTLVFGTPTFSVGENVLVYLDTWRDGSLRVHQMLLGKFSIITDSKTGKQFAVRNVAETGVQVLDQSSPGSITNRMELSAYTEMVRQRYQVNRSVARQFDREAYGNIPILDQPAGYSRSAQKGGLEPQFHVWNPPTRWFEPDNGQSVVFKVNVENAPPQAESDVLAATNAWSSVPGCSLRVLDGGTTSGCGLFNLDGENTISFNNCDGYFSGTGPCTSGILAVTSIANYDRFQQRVINGVTFNKALESNLTFNPFASCYFNDHAQLQEIMTHEMGHGLGLLHSWDTTFPPGPPTANEQAATMYWIAHFDGRAASLRQDDVDGITFIYPSQGGGPGPLTIVSTSPLGTATVGSAFSRQLIASGGTLPYSWSIVSGSLPGGLSMALNGLIGGTPTAVGTSNFTVKLTDAQNTAVQKDFQIVVISPATGYDSHFVSQEVPSTLQPGQSFVVTIRWLNTGSKSWDGATGFSIHSQNPADNVTWGGNQVPWINGAVGPGAQLELLFQAFAPTRSGTYDFQWQLNHPEVGFFGDKSVNVSITVGDGGPAPSQPAINGPSTLAAVTGTPLGANFTVTGGTAPFSWQIASGALPQGVSLNTSTGAIAGTPTSPGTFGATVQVTDSASKTAQKTLTITVAAPPVTITTGLIPSATKGVAFNTQLTAMGGKPPYTWTVTTGALPAGLSLAPSTGIISGTPTTIGDFGFTATATDAESHAATKILTITVAPEPLAVNSIPALSGTMGSSFSYQFSAKGGRPAYLWSITSGSLPAGVTLNSTTGVISGVPTAAGVFTFTVAVRDQGSASASANVQISLIDPATIPAITKVRYKNGKKLIVDGQRVNRAAVLYVDGTPLSAVPDEGTFLVKPIVLVRGTHEIKIVNPGGVASTPFLLGIE